MLRRAVILALAAACALAPGLAAAQSVPAPPPPASAPAGADPFAAAREMLRTGRYQEVDAAAQAAKQAGGPASIAAVLRAQALEATGRIDQAIEVLREVEGDPLARRARLLLGEYLIATGRRKDARAPLMTLIEDYNSDAIGPADAEGLSLVGRAAHLLRSARDANDAFNDAEKAGGNLRVDTLLWRAELFLDKYDPGHASQVVQEAAKLAPEDPHVRIAIARVKLESALDFDGAEAELRKALEVNPRLAAAHAVRAGLALRDLEIDAADRACDEGLKTNPRDLELLSMKAAARFLADDDEGFQALQARVLGLNPEYTRFFQIVSEYAEWEHRYDAIIAFMRQATSMDARDEKGWAQLGLNLIRAGDEKAGLEALQKAWDIDRFNVRVYNTLNLYERDIATQYVTVSGQTFRVRYHKDEKAVLERLVPRMLEEAWRDMVKRYRFTPSTPVSIELYGDGEHFSVRTSGLPNVGIQGVCFGKTLAMLSPRAAGFNWGNVLWHELAHVFAIQASKSHVPRWFTEGLSEYETIVRRPEWRREEDPALYAALRAGRLPTIERFNRAFTHVDTVEEVTTAYYAASQLIVYMVERFGFERVAAMLPLWGQGKRTGDVVREALGVASDDVDRGFRGWLKARLARYDRQFVPDLQAPPRPDAEDAVRASPRDAKKRVLLAVALLREGEVERARKELEEALRLDPRQPDGRYLQLRLAMGDDDSAEVARLVHDLASSGHDGYAVRMRAADVAEGRKDWKALREELEAAHRFDPSQAEPLQALVDIAHAKKDAVSELAALRPLVLVDQHDRRAWSRLLDGLVARHEWREAIALADGAAFVDPANPEIHRLRARAYARDGRHLTAIEAYNTALIAGAAGDQARGIYAELAKGYEKLGKVDLAARARQMAGQVKDRPVPGGPPGASPRQPPPRPAPPGRTAPPGGARPAGEPPPPR